MAKTALERWRAQALAVPGEVLSSSVPLPVLLDEAKTAARFHRSHWEPLRSTRGRALRRGLCTAANERLTPETGRELLSLRRAVEQADAALRLARGKRPASPAPRARRALREIRATAAWVLGEADAQARAGLAHALAAHPSAPRGEAALAAALEAWAAFAEPHRRALAGAGGFDPKRLDEARALATALRARASAPRAPSPAESDALALRNKLVALLQDKIATVRAAARFVYRDEPALVREVTSAYERARRATARRAP